VGRRRLADRAELDRHLEWLRYAIHDRHVDVRLVLEGLLDVIEGLAGPAPGPPHRPAGAAGPEDGLDGEPAGVVLQ
jgi:hypothetical protein